MRQAGTWLESILGLIAIVVLAVMVADCLRDPHEDRYEYLVAPGGPMSTQWEGAE